MTKSNRLNIFNFSWCLIFEYLLCIINWITMTRNQVNTCACHMEPLDSCFDLIRYNQQCNGDRTSDHRIETLLLSYWSSSQTSDAKSTRHGNCTPFNLMCLVTYICTHPEDKVTSRDTSSHEKMNFMKTEKKKKNYIICTCAETW